MAALISCPETEFGHGAGQALAARFLEAEDTALLQHVRTGREKNATPWLLALLKRKPPKLVAVVLANKIARIAWKMMMTGEAYQRSAALPAQACAA